MILTGTRYQTGGDGIGHNIMNLVGNPRLPRMNDKAVLGLDMKDVWGDDIEWREGRILSTLKALID